MQRACSLQGPGRPTHAARPARRTDRNYTPVTNGYVRSSVDVILLRCVARKSSACWRSAVDVPSALLSCTVTPWRFVSVARAFGEDVQTQWSLILLPGFRDAGRIGWPCFSFSTTVSNTVSSSFSHESDAILIYCAWNDSEKKISEANVRRGFSLLSWFSTYNKKSTSISCHFVSQLCVFMLVRVFVNMSRNMRLVFCWKFDVRNETL